MNDEMVYVTKSEMQGYLQKIKSNRNSCIAMMGVLSLVIAACIVQGVYPACIPAVCGFCFLGYRLFTYSALIKKITTIIYSRSLSLL
jgi:hypothetical protein